MKTNNIAELLKAKGIVADIEVSPTQTTTPSSTTRRKRLYQSPPDEIYSTKLEPNLSQSRADLKAKPTPKLSQSEAKLEPKLSRQIQPTEKLEPKLRPQLEPKLSQSEAKVEPKIFFEELIGLQRKVLIYIFEMCVRTGSRNTPPVTISNLAVAVETTVSAGRKAIQRLEEKGFIIRQSFKDGRGGWTKYELKEETYKSLMLDSRMSKLEPNLSQSRAKVSTQLEPQLEPTASSSSRELYLNKSTTTGDVGSLNFKLESVAEFGITESAVARCFELYPLIDREKIQDLINRFAQFMRTGDGKRVQNARGFFISLAEQLSKGITPLDHIETPETRLMRELVEKKRQQKSEEERLAKEMRDFDFEDWWDGLSQESRDALVKPSGISPSGSQSQKMLAKQIHAEKFWPDRKKKALAESVAGV